MANFIRLEGIDGQIWYINPEHVAAIHARTASEDNATIMLSDGHPVIVKETPEFAKSKLSERPSS